MTAALVNGTRRTAGCALVNLNAACAITGLPARLVRNLIEEQRLRFAFNIARRSAWHVETRVSLESLIAYLAGDTAHLAGGAVESVLARARQDETECDAWLRRTLAPHVTKGNLRASMAARLLNCDPQHVCNLIKDGSLKVSIPAKLAKESPMISAAAFTAWLKARRLP